MSDRTPHPDERAPLESKTHAPRITLLAVGFVVVSIVLSIGSLALMRGHDEEHSGVAGHISGGLRPSAPSTPDDEGWWGTALPEPIEAVSFALTDQHGERFSFPADGSRVSLLYFGYTSCRNVCPGTMAVIAESIRRLDPVISASVDVVFVTTDPARDTETRLQEWLALFDPSFVGLTGSLEEVEAIQQLYGVPVAQRRHLGGDAYGSTHLDQVMAFGPDGVARYAYAPGTDPDALAADLTRLASTH